MLVWALSPNPTTPNGSETEGHDEPGKTPLNSHGIINYTITRVIPILSEKKQNENSMKNKRVKSKSISKT